MSPDFDESRLEDYSSAELVQYITASPPVSPSSPRVFLLSPNLVAKECESEDSAADEVAGMELAHELGLRVPTVKRVVRAKRDAYIIMNRIRGTSLENAWHQMGWITTIRIAFQLRRFVRAMRTQMSSTAGSLVSGKCNSIWLEDYYGPPRHATPEKFTSFISFWLQPVTNRKIKIAPPAHRQFIPPTPASFVFTHQDLAPRNLFINENNDLWVLDWERSGWYPKYFEYVGMQNFFDRLKWNRLGQWRWWLFSWISVGIYQREQDALNIVRHKCKRFPIARRSIVLEEGAHPDALHMRRKDI
jgi:hypothetical protein